MIFGHELVRELKNRTDTILPYLSFIVTFPRQEYCITLFP